MDEMLSLWCGLAATVVASISLFGGMVVSPWMFFGVIPVVFLIQAAVYFGTRPLR